MQPLLLPRCFPLDVELARLSSIKRYVRACMGLSVHARGSAICVFMCGAVCACVGLCVHGAVRPYLGLYVQAWGTRCVHAWAWVCMSVGHSCPTTNCAHPGMRHVGQCAVADGCQLCACVGQCVHACGCVCMHEAMPACVGQFRACMKKCLHVWGSFEHTWARACLHGAVRACMWHGVHAWGSA